MLAKTASLRYSNSYTAFRPAISRSSRTARTAVRTSRSPSPPHPDQSQSQSKLQGHDVFNIQDILQTQGNFSSSLSTAIAKAVDAGLRPMAKEATVLAFQADAQAFQKDTANKFEVWNKKMDFLQLLGMVTLVMVVVVVFSTPNAMTLLASVIEFAKKF